MSAGNPDQKVYVYAVFSSLILRVDFGVDFWSFFARFSAVFGQKPPKSTRNRLLLKGLLWVLGGAGQEVCGWKSGDKPCQESF